MMNLKTKTILLALFILTLAGITFVLNIGRTRASVSQVTIVPGSLEALAQTTIAEGKQAVDIDPWLWEYRGVSGIDQALSEYSVAIGRPVSSKSYVWNSEHQTIGTWYKFAISEWLSKKSYVGCADCAPLPDAPAAFLPLNTGEILIPKYGGSVEVSGVKMSLVDPNFSDYQTSQSYLLFLAVDSSKGVGVVSTGLAGAFLIDANQRLVPLTQMRTSVAQDLAERYGNSLASLRQALGVTPAVTPTPSPCSVSTVVIRYCINNGGDWNKLTCKCE